ncbi:hypothetical protein [Dyella monticola]|uniref:hypothetical protein n=1 Tax=Dyella monticola TaxID=1927958 RepID=UPI0011C018E8|nr:hypothetical protein [Dyella monticola]
MNKTPYVLAMLLAVGIGTCFSSAHAAAVVVTHSAAPSYSVTTVRTTGPYVIYPASCCYTSVVVRSVPSTATVKVIAPPPPPTVRVVYATPVVTTYPTTRVVYAPATVYMPATYYYVH